MLRCQKASGKCNIISVRIYLYFGDMWFVQEPGLSILLASFLFSVPTVHLPFYLLIGSPSSRAEQQSPLFYHLTPLICWTYLYEIWFQHPATQPDSTFCVCSLVPKRVAPRFLLVDNQALWDLEPCMGCGVRSMSTDWVKSAHMDGSKPINWLFYPSYDNWSWKTHFMPWVSK